MELKAKPQDESFSGKYENENFIAKFLVNNYFKSVSKLINQIPNIHLIKNSIEIGCGEGFSTQKLSKILPNSISLGASEYVSKQIPSAKQRNPEIEIIQENIYSLKRERNSLELIFLLEVLEHLDHPSLALNEIKRVLNENGYLIIGVPREPIWRILNICRFKYIKDFGNTPGHLNHWSKKSFVKYLEKNFGKVVSIESPLPWTIALVKPKKLN